MKKSVIIHNDLKFHCVYMVTVTYPLLLCTIAVVILDFDFLL